MLSSGKPYNLIESITCLHHSVFDVASEKFNDPGMYQNKLPLITAIKSGLIDANTAFFDCPILKRGFLLSDAIKLGFINDAGKVQNTATGQFIGLTEAVAEGLLKRLPRPIPLHLALRCRLIAPDGITIDPDSDKYQRFGSAVDSGLLELRSTVLLVGQQPITAQNAQLEGIITRDGMLNLLKRIVPLLEAYEMGFLINCQPPLLLHEAIQLGAYNSDENTFVFASEKLTLREALKKRFIDSYRSLVKIGNETMSVNMAIQSGRMDAKRCVLVHNGGVIDLTSAFNRNMLLPQRTLPITLVEAVKSKFYDAGMKRFTIGECFQMSYTLLEAVNEGLITTQHCFVLDLVSESTYSIKRATHRGLIDLVDARIYTSFNGNFTKVSLPEAVDLGLLMYIPENADLKMFCENGVYLFNDDRQCRIFNTVTSTYTTLKIAVEQRSVNPNSFVVRSGGKNYCNYWQAAKQKLFNDDKGTLLIENGSEVSLLDAWDSGWLMEAAARYTLYDILQAGLFCAEDSRFAVNDQELSLSQAIRSGILLTEVPALKISGEGALLSLEEVLSLQQLDRHSCRLTLENSRCITLNEAAENGLIINPHSSFSLFELFEMGVIDKTNRITDPCSGQKLSFAKAIEVGLLDANNSLLCVGNSSVETLTKMTEKKTVNLKLGTLTVAKVSMCRLLNRYDCLPNRRPLSLRCVFENELCDDDSGRFFDPVGRDWLALDAALKFNLIDSQTTFLLCSKNTDLKPVKKAIESELVSVVRGEIYDDETDNWLKFREAHQKGILLTLEPNLNMKDAIEKNRINLRKCTFTDYRLDIVLPLEVAIKGGFLDCAGIYVKSYKKTDSPIPLRVALRTGVIDFSRRVVIDPDTSECYPLVLLFDNTIAILSRKSYTLRYLIEHDCIDVNTGLVTDPMTEDKLTLVRALQSGVLDCTSAVVKDLIENRLLDLKQAQEKGILNDENGEYHSGESICSFTEAIDRSLIYTSSDTMLLIDAIRFGLYESGAVRWPFSGGARRPLPEAFARRLIDARTFVLVEPSSGLQLGWAEACQAGLLDRSTGTVFDASGSEQMDLMDAYERGLIFDKYVTGVLLTSVIGRTTIAWMMA